MSWQILLGISILTAAILQLLQRIIMKNSPANPIVVSGTAQILTGALIGLVALGNGIEVKTLLEVLPNIILMSFMYGVSNILIFKAFQSVQASTMVLLFSSRAIWSILGAILVLGEVFLWQHLIGTFLILLSIGVISIESFKLKNIGLNLKGGAVLILIAALMQGLEWVNDAFIIQRINPMFYASMVMILPGLLTLGLFPKKVLEINKLFKANILFKLLAIALCWSLTSITLFYAYDVGRNAAQIAPLLQTTTLLTVLFGIIFLKETDKLNRKIIGGSLAVLGAILLN